MHNFLLCPVLESKTSTKLELLLESTQLPFIYCFAYTGHDAMLLHGCAMKQNCLQCARRGRMG
eukprot:47417-Amphidinium_carterae.1